MRTMGSACSQARLRELFDYDQETGVFTRRRSRRKVGHVSWRKSRTPYLRINVDGSFHYAHRLVFLWMTGDWPQHEVDHIDRNGLNNSWANLRDVPRSVGCWNTGLSRLNKTGVKGVIRTPTGWRAFHGNRGIVGRFKTFEEACAARRRVEEACDAKYGFSIQSRPDVPGGMDRQ